MNKKSLIIIAIIAGLVIMGFAAFWFLFKNQTKPGGNTFLSYFFPFAAEQPIEQFPASTTTPPTIQLGQADSLNQLTKVAVADATTVIKEKEDKTKIEVVRYIEKSTGHIYETEPQGENLSEISNMTIPAILDVLWSNDKKQFIVRYLKSNETGTQDSIMNLSFLSSTSTEGVFLSSEITSIASSPAENKVFYLMPYQSANIGITSSFNQKTKKQIFSTPFGEFQASWPNKNIIALLSRPSAFADGFLYKLNPTDGSLERILGKIKGLTALFSPDGEKILYSETANYGVKSNIYLVKEKSFSSFNIATLPEKCIWSKINKAVFYCAIPKFLPAMDYPDNWYQGLVSFSDVVWKINADSGTSELISDIAGVDLDIINIFSDNNENYLFFQNKKDGALWSLKLNP